MFKTELNIQKKQLEQQATVEKKKAQTVLSRTRVTSSPALCLMVLFLPLHQRRANATLQPMTDVETLEKEEGVKH